MKKLSTVLVSVTLVAGLLAGCGPKTNIGNPLTTSPQAAISTKPINLKIFTFTNDGQIRAVAAAYKVKNPKVTIDVENVASDYGSVLKTKLNSGDIPDIFQSQAYSTNALYKDIVLDLTNEPFMKDIEDNAKVGATLDGKVYGLPLSVQAYGFIYNKKLFADAGITELPKTYSQLEADAKLIQAKGVIPFANDYKEWWVFKHILSQFLAADDQTDYAKTAAEITAGTKKFGALKYDAQVFNLVDLTLKYGSPKPLETDLPGAETLIANGKAALLHNGTWTEDGIRKINANVDLGFIPEPVDEDASKAKLMVDSSVLMRISKTSKNVDTAKSFLAFMNSWIKDNGIGSDIPTVKGAKAPDSQLAKETIQYMANKQTYPWVQGYWPDGFDAQVGQLFQAYIAKTKTKQQVLDEMNKQWKILASATK
jgi:raffinose/stachyose/melibiose transport system substrate-binding protein